MLCSLPFAILQHNYRHFLFATLARYSMSIPSIFSDFLEIFPFSRILSLKSFCNSRENSYAHILVMIN